MTLRGSGRYDDTQFFFLMGMRNGAYILRMGGYTFSSLDLELGAILLPPLFLGEKTAFCLEGIFGRCEKEERKPARSAQRAEYLQRKYRAEHSWEKAKRGMNEENDGILERRKIEARAEIHAVRGTKQRWRMCPEIWRQREAEVENRLLPTQTGGIFAKRL